MNKVELLGRLTKDPELKQTASGISACKFTVAVNRRFKNADGEYEADFINCVAWRQTADLICKYFSKGSQIGLVGNIQTRNYDNKDGQRVFVTEVVVEELHFVGERKSGTDQGSSTASMPDIPNMPEMPGEDNDLPF